MKSKHAFIAATIVGLAIVTLLVSRPDKTEPAQQMASATKIPVPHKTSSLLGEPAPGLEQQVGPQLGTTASTNAPDEPPSIPPPQTWVDRLNSERQQAYRECQKVPGPEYESSIFFGMDTQTKESMAHVQGNELQGCAAWHAATDHAAADNTQQAEFYSVLASLALDSPEPLLSIYENFWTSDAMKQTAVAYLFFAENQWPDSQYLKSLTTSFSQREKEEAESKIREVSEFASRIAAAHLGD
ncbi:MAG: hypothetical protein AB8G17_15060 [Gammaproteobacteria bacterium]